MSSLTFRLTTALLTFFLGLGVATAWVFHKNEPVLEPVSLETTSDASLEIVFVIDTTGSMGGLLEGAKQRIWGIVNEVMQSSTRPTVKIGLVAYRDHGDQYVTQVLPLTNDLDKVYATLMNYEAGGGGDGPEDVRRALSDGLKRAGWSTSSPRVAQIMFLVGDAPPHDDYLDEPATTLTAAEAVAEGKVINTIQCGSLADTTQVWRAIAQNGQGQYFSIPQDGGVQSINTPYDQRLGELAGQLGTTYVAYGGGGGAEGDKRRDTVVAETRKFEADVEAMAPSQAKAERALNKAVNTSAYVGDLLQSIENGSIKLEAVKEEDLPADLRTLSIAERKAEVERRLTRRRELRAQILELSKQRSDYISAARKKQTGSTDDGFDVAVSKALKDQLQRKGIK